MPTVYPCVPGHEIVGRVVKVGSAVKKFKEGDIAAVGCLVDSCRTCPTAATVRAVLRKWDHADLQLRRQDSRRRHLRRIFGQHRGGRGVRPARAERLDPAGAAPLLCAGITTYSPLRHWKVGKGQKVGVVGWADWGTWA